MRTYILCGQLHSAFADERLLFEGIHSLGNRIAARGHETRFWNARDIYSIERALDDGELTALVGYSLGGIYVSWIAYDRPNIKFPLIVSYDPIANIANGLRPLGRNVKRAICFQQTSCLLTSLLYGRSVLVSGEGGPIIEVYKRVIDHPLMQYQEDFHQITLDAIDAAV